MTTWLEAYFPSSNFRLLLQGNLEQGTKVAVFQLKTQQLDLSSNIEEATRRDRNKVTAVEGDPVAWYDGLINPDVFVTENPRVYRVLDGTQAWAVFIG